jgi:hypothetical protein
MWNSGNIVVSQHIYCNLRVKYRKTIDRLEVDWI